MSLLSRYPKGSDITILNATYKPRTRDEDTGKISPDYMVISYKDNTNKTKGHEIIYEPTYEFYMANDDVIINHNMFYIEKEKVHTVECKNSELLKTIAELTGNEELFYENIRNRNFSGNRLLHTIPIIFSSDSNIEDHYRARFSKEYANEAVPITKGYFDIETDGTRVMGDFPEMGETPITAVSYIDDSTNTINVFLLRDPYGDNPLIEEFETCNFSDRNKMNNLFVELQEFIIENVGGLEKAKEYKVDNLNFEFMFFDDEIELLKTLFGIINRNNPDFMMAWNLPFDFCYIYERCRRLGVDPALIMSSPTYTEKYARYYIDEMHKNEYELRGDFFEVGADTVYIDQLVQFASRRKGQAAFPNFKLDTAADIITKGAVRKLDYSHITKNLAHLPYIDYRIFVFYNIMDTVAQKCIEETVEDVDYLFATAVDNDTRYSKCHRQTVYLTNRTRKFFYKEGYILGNNCNTGDSKPFAGALVGDPTHNSDYAKLKGSYEQIYNIVDNSDDFDFKSLYPSEEREHNMAPNTIVGKIIIDGKVHKYENPYHNKFYDRGGQFIEDLVTGNALEFGKRWFNFAGFMDMLYDIDEFYKTHMPSTRVEYSRDGKLKPFVVRPECKENIKPFVFLEEDERIKPFTINDYGKDDYIDESINNDIL